MAGLETVIAVRAPAGDKVAITLAAPGTHFVYEPYSTLAPFSDVEVPRRSLAEFAQDFGAELLQDSIDWVIHHGQVARLGLVVPPDVEWTLPIYELALQVGADVRATGAPTALTLLTHEARPLEVSGNNASDELTGLLEDAGVTLETRVRVERTPEGHKPALQKCPVVWNASRKPATLSGQGSAGRVA